MPCGRCVAGSVIVLLLSYLDLDPHRCPARETGSLYMVSQHGDRGSRLICKFLIYFTPLLMCFSNRLPIKCTTPRHHIWTHVRNEGLGLTQIPGWSSSRRETLRQVVMNAEAREPLSSSRQYLASSSRFRENFNPVPWKSQHPTRA